jgi:hypothetical protein
MGLAETGHGACLTAQSPPGTAVTQEQCTNAGNQQWVYLGTPSENNPIQIQNVGTGQCMDASSFGNAAPVVQVACGAGPGERLVRLRRVDAGLAVQPQHPRHLPWAYWASTVKLWLWRSMRGDATTAIAGSCGYAGPRWRRLPALCCGPSSARQG